MPRRLVRNSGRKPKRTSRRSIDYGKLEPRAMLAVVVSEFVASNTNSFEDGFGSTPDWIELHNNGTTPVNLNGYTLSDDPSNPNQWAFEGNVTIAPNEYMVVFASGDDLVDPAGYFHTNFRLSAGGDYIGLYDPSGAILSSFGNNGADFPAQVADVSYGLTGGTLIDGTSTSFFLEPTNSSVDNIWQSVNFNAAANGFSLSSSAIGYETNPGSSTSYVGEFTQQVTPGRTSVYLRSEFNITDASAVSNLLLELQYDDGFIAYLNGTIVAQVNAPNSPNYLSSATGQHSDSLALNFTPFSLNNDINLLQDGTNVLAIHALNANNSSDFLLVPRLTSNVSGGSANYLATPTPEFENSSPVSIGPAIESVTQNGVAVNPNDSLVISASVSDFALPVDNNSVRLHYRSNFGAEITLAANDNGVNGDATANDGIFSATVSNVGAAGQLFRWYFTASDTAGNESRAPTFADPLNSAEYFGTVVTDPSLTTDLPVFQWFVQNTAGTFTDAGARGSLFFNGEFYDNIDANAHGQSTRLPEFPKKSFDFDSNSGEKFLISDEIGRASDFNLLTNYADQTKIRNTLAYDIWEKSGHPASLDAFSVYVQRNGEFYGLYDLVEEGDEEYLDRNGLDTNGALYKVNNPLNSSTNQVDKDSREYEGNGDLQELVNAVQGLSSTALSRWIYDNVDVAALINYAAVNALIGNSDFGHKNMYWYRDTEGTGLWTVLPWDQDLSFGHQWIASTSPPYFDNRLFTTSDLTPGLNSLFQRIYSDSTFNEMFNRRLKTLSDEIYGAPGTNVEDSYFATKARELEALTAAEAIEDQNLWGLQSNFAAAYPFNPSQAVDQLVNDYVGARRDFINNRFGVPSTQSGIPQVRFNTTDLVVTPASGLQSEEYIRIDNPTNTSADISGWRLTGGIRHEFQAGTIIPAGGRLYVVNDVPSFLARTTGPGDNQFLTIQGGYDGQISNMGETINLVTASDQSVDVFNTPVFANTPNQDFLRVTEVNYSPAAAQSGTEFVEFFNQSTTGVTLDLSGVTVTDGFSTPFVFPAGTTLAPQEFVVIVEDVISFTNTYTSIPVTQIVGQFDGSLNNNGETIQVDDSNGEKILEFQYSNVFPWPDVDSNGQSLNIIDSNSDGDLPTSWVAAAPSPGADAPTFLPGDVNQDGIVNFQDISPFISLLSAGGFLDEADMNQDGVVDFLDISGFIDELAMQ